MSRDTTRASAVDPLSRGPTMSAGIDLGPVQLRELLQALRDRLLDAAVTAYAENLKAAKQDLMQLGLRASDPDRRALYEAGYALLLDDASGLLRRFRIAFGSEYDTAVATLEGREPTSWEPVGELSLVDTDEFERDLAIDRVAAKAAYSCSQQLTALDRRVGAMLGLKRLDSDSNPLSLKRLFRAFVRAADECGGGEDLALVLLETFEHYTADELPEIYRRLNQHLADNGVLATMRIELEERDCAIKGFTSDPEEGDTFARLIKSVGAMSGQGLAGVGGGTGGGSGSPDAAGGGLPHGAQVQMGTMVLGQLIDGLTGLQRGSGQAAADLGINVGDFDPASSESLRSLAGSPLLKWLKPMDRLTVDLIAKLFDCIFADPEVPRALQNELGRLQVPILKIALTNKAFFSDQQHPARRLMDLIAAAARGWGKDGEEQLLEAIRSAVNRVIADFESDTSVFRDQSEQLELVLHEADRRARQNVSELVHRLEQRDRNVVAPTVVGDQIRRQLAGQDVPAPVEEFISQYWRDLLIRIYINYGEKSEPWERALRTLADLIWSVQPKTSPAERQRLMALLPDLLNRLPEGLAQIGKSAVWESFLQEIMQLHMQAIKPKAAESKTPSGQAEQRPIQGATDMGDSLRGNSGEDPQASGRNLQQGSGDRTTATVGGGAGDSDTGGLGQEAVADAPHSATATDEFTQAARQIEVGDWIELSGIDGSTLTLRASWMSRVSGLSLFADRYGRNPQILRLEQLAHHLRRGNARVLSKAPLTGRAVARLLTEAVPQEPPALVAAGDADDADYWPSWG